MSKVAMAKTTDGTAAQARAPSPAPNAVAAMRGVGVVVLTGLLHTAAASTTAAQAVLIRGVSYGPVPLKSVVGASELPEDDWFCDEAVPMWGPAGRADLRNIRRIGANFVRLYGNNPNNDHTNFLDAARAETLSVAAGMSDYPYYQQQSTANCQMTGYDCFSQVKPLYLMNLQNGFLTSEGQYHSALKYMNILNEPDLKMPPTCTTGGPEGPMQMARALISGFDAMLDAEKDLGVTGPLINFTATFSYAICGACERFPDKPALGQMATLDDAMRNPDKYGYVPKNDILAAYLARFTHSFNTQNPATDLQHQFLDDYAATFPGTPVYIGEYHRVPANQTEDLAVIFSLAEAQPLFLGISFFEYQVAYWKQGSEMDFGMFGLGDLVLQQMPYFSKTYDVYCLAPVEHAPSGMTMPDAVALAFGGESVDTELLCVPNPLGVDLTQEGLEKVVVQDSVAQAEMFMERVIQHMGGTVSDRAELYNAAAGLVAQGSAANFAQIASTLGSKPTWVDFDTKARCVANRNVAPSVVGEAIGWTCQNAKTFSCDSVPVHCNSTYRIGDYIFSRYYEELGSSASPLEHCSFGGAALFAPSAVYEAWTGSSQCVSGMEATSTTSADVGDTTSEGASTESPATTAETTAGPVQIPGFSSAAPRPATPCKVRLSLSAFTVVGAMMGSQR